MTRSSRKQSDEAPKDEEVTAKAETPSEDEAPKVEIPAPPKSKTKAIAVVFVPIGIVNVHLYTPSGNEYHIKPREEFKIAAEDVDWFFNEWDWCFRQRLVRAADYKPTCGYHDPKDGIAPAKAEVDSGEKE